MTWIKVDDQLPELGKHVIARDAQYNEVHEAWRMTHSGAWQMVGLKDDCHVTHWQPMPVFTGPGDPNA